MMRAGRSILITGCSTGIGLASARRLKSKGWRVIATARKPDDIARLQRDEGLETLTLELSDPASIAAAADAALSLTSGRLDALYNNAAYGIVGAMEDIPASTLREHFEVNVIAAHELTRRIVPAMRAQGHGRIVMCSSVLGIVSGPYRGAYAGSKYALEAISDALRIELKPAGIHVSILEPGPIDTNFLASTIARFKSAIDVAGSPHKDDYRLRLARMEAGGRAQLRQSVDPVVDCLVHALESSRPRARYRIGLATRGAAILKRALPDSLLDRILARM